jgi:hypothetical protein
VAYRSSPSHIVQPPRYCRERGHRCCVLKVVVLRKAAWTSSRHGIHFFPTAAARVVQSSCHLTSWLYTEISLDPDSFTSAWGQSSWSSTVSSASNTFKSNHMKSSISYPIKSQRHLYRIATTMSKSFIVTAMWYRGPYSATWMVAETDT